MYNYRQKVGSMTAKGGFLNEKDICKKFINYKDDDDAIEWLSLMGYDYKNIVNLKAIQIPVRINFKTAINLGVSKDKYEETIRHKKADIQVQLKIKIDKIQYIENISLKKANKSAGFNQIDKRPVETYRKIWGFDEKIYNLLSLFTGKITPDNYLHLKKNRDKRRLFLNEMTAEDQEVLIKYFEENKLLILTDLIMGRGGLRADFFLVTRKNEDDSLDWILSDINSVCNFYSKGKVKLTPRGSLKIGRITMQRKGGTPDPTSLQFKLNPLDLFKS